MSRDTETGVVLTGLRWLSFAVLMAGTIRAIYLAAFGDGLVQSASLGRLVAISLAAAIVFLWERSRRE